VRSGGARRRTAWAAALGLFVVLLFAHTVRARAPWFGKLSDGRMFWLTAHTWRVLENWWEEGALSSRFLLYDNPRSVEHRSRADRVPYVSYPPGAMLPPFALARITGIRPSPSLIMAYDLANHLAIALLLAALGFAAARSSGIEPRLAALAGASPAAVVLLAPGPMYWFQNVYFADQAVILPFVLALVLEWARGSGGRAGRLAARLSPWVVLWGCLVDYLFVFVTLALFVGRWLAGEHGLRPAARLRATLRFWLAPAAALALFGLHLAASGEARSLVGRALWRAGPATRAADGGEAHPLLFWLPAARFQYGASGVALLVASALALAGLAIAARRRADATPAERRGAARLLGLAALALAPCLAQLYALRQHSAIHDFSVLKLVVPLALLPFVVLPLAVLERLRARRPAAAGRRAGLVVLATTAAAATYLGAVHPGFAALFPPSGVGHAKAAALLRRECGYRDIVFSPHLEIDRYPPQLLALSRERVYRVAGPRDLRRRAREMTAGLEEPYRLCVLLLGGTPPEWRPVVRGLRPARAGRARLFCGIRATSPRAPG
jgi:hypothetical protein